MREGPRGLHGVSPLSPTSVSHFLPIKGPLQFPFLTPDLLRHAQERPMRKLAVSENSVIKCTFLFEDFCWCIIYRCLCHCYIICIGGYTVVTPYPWRTCSEPVTVQTGAQPCGRHAPLPRHIMSHCTLSQSHTQCALGSIPLFPSGRHMAINFAFTMQCALKRHTFRCSLPLVLPIGLSGGPRSAPHYKTTDSTKPYMCCVSSYIHTSVIKFQL